MARIPGSLPAEIAGLNPDSWTEPFWLAAAEHRLVAARCGACATFRMPPSPFCHVCRSQDIDWTELNGTGTVFTFTVVRHAVVPVVREHVPYVVAVVDLDGAPGARLVTQLVGMAPEHVTIGMPVGVVWDDVAEGVSVPRVMPS